MYTLITHMNKSESVYQSVVWYIGLSENGIVRPIPEREAAKICNLLNVIMEIPEENLAQLIEFFNQTKEVKIDQSKASNVQNKTA